MLRKRGCALRVRCESGKSLLTFKGPVQGGPMKVREEHETVVADGDVLEDVFGELGFRPWFRYQKFREEFGGEDVTIAIDETPVGTFVEIEGGEAAIHGVAQALGRTSADYILDSYRALFLKRREQYGISGNDMVFDPA
jgi:adenylate cyclase class 2